MLEHPVALPDRLLLELIYGRMPDSTVEIEAWLRAVPDSVVQEFTNHAAIRAVVCGVQGSGYAGLNQNQIASLVLSGSWYWMEPQPFRHLLLWLLRGYHQTQCE